MDAVEFWSICSVNGLALSQEQMEQFKRYVQDLAYWNEKVNLISRRDMDNIWLRHMLHSVSIAFTGELPRSGKVLDIGTGGGLPGIPLKIINPKLDVTLLDSIAKKAQTVGMLASHITKHGLRAIRNRAEEMLNDPKHKGPYDLVVSRATAPLVDLMKWSQPILKAGEDSHAQGWSVERRDPSGADEVQRCRYFGHRSERSRRRVVHGRGETAGEGRLAGSKRIIKVST